MTPEERIVDAALTAFADGVTGYTDLVAHCVAHGGLRERADALGVRVPVTTYAFSWRTPTSFGSPMTA